MTPHDLLALRYGYGEAAGTGALDWRRVEVDTVDELRRAVATDGTWARVRGGYQDEGGAWHRVVYASDPNGPPIDVAPNVAIDGFGGPRITGRGLRFRHANNLVSGLAIIGCAGDALEVTSGGRDVCFMRMWIEDWGDEALALVRAPSGRRDDTLGVSLLISTITRGNKCVLVGGTDGRTADERYRLTVSRARFKDVGLRAPFRVRSAKCHAEFVEVDGVTGSTACHVESGARALFNDCVFRRLAGDSITYSDSAALRLLRVHGNVTPSQNPARVTTPSYASGG